MDGLNLTQNAPRGVFSCRLGFGDGFGWLWLHYGGRALGLGFECFKLPPQLCGFFTRLLAAAVAVAVAPLAASSSRKTLSRRLWLA